MKLKDDAGITIKQMDHDCACQSKKWKDKGAGYTPNAATLLKLAEYFGVSVDYLLTGKEQKTMDTNELKYALWGGEQGMTDEQFKEVMRFASFVKERDSK